MNRRKLELTLVLICVALVALLLRPAPEPVTQPPAQPLKPPAVQTKLEFSEDTKWILKTAADSYAPRVPVEKAWNGSDTDKSVKED